jgi:hypothetical protein
MNMVSHQIKNEEVIDTKANCPFLIVMTYIAEALAGVRTRIWK